MLTTGDATSIPIVGIAAVVAAFGVRGYSAAGDTLFVHRPGWSTRLDLSELRHVEARPGITLGSIRTFGNGGLVESVGYSRNELPGTYKAFATDGMSAVLLRFASIKLVVTPDAPAEFVEAIGRGANLPETHTPETRHQSSAHGTSRGEMGDRS